MKRTRTTKGKENADGFLHDFMVQINDGIHRELEDSQDYIEKNELQDYITEEGHLDGDAINANEDLTVENVLHLGANHAWYSIHRNWHEVMEGVAKDHGLSDDDVADARGVAREINKLPPALRKIMKKALADAIKDEEGKK